MNDKNYGLITAAVFVVSIAAAIIAYLQTPLTTIKDCFIILAMWAVCLVGLLFFAYIVFLIVNAFIGGMDLKEKTLRIIFWLIVPIGLFVYALAEVL